MKGKRKFRNVIAKILENFDVRVILGDDFSYDLESLFQPHDEYDICNIIGSGFGEVITLIDDNPTIFEERQLCMHVDHEKNILCDSYIVEFDYDPTCNCYERGK